MQKYSRETVAEVLAANDIVEVIGASLELKPSGSGRHVGLCPFHNEKTPSFSVNRDRQIFYCFGCEKGGDAIKFLCEHEGLTFVEALQKLADRGSVQLPALSERDSREDYERIRLLEVGKSAARFFTETLNDPLKGGKGRRYLKTRNLKGDTVKRFGLGYAPEPFEAFGDAARQAGLKSDTLLAAGLLKRSERGRTYGFFRDRLMFPIKDVSGNVVAFGGRDLSEESKAKYINTPENRVYKKGRVLYGLHEARDALRREKCAILVEGYFDLLRCFDVGVENVVAPCGTALTPEQASLIRRYVPEVVVVFDGDSAGVRAALRGVAILAAAGLGVRAMLLPEGQDPDDFILARGADAFRAEVEGAHDFITFYVTMSAERLATIEGRTDVAKEIFSILAGIDDVLRCEEYLRRAALALGLNEWTVRSEFTKWMRHRPGQRKPTAPEEAQQPKFHKDDTDFVAILLGSEPLLKKVCGELEGVSLEPGPVKEVLDALSGGQGSDLAERLETDEARVLYAAAANRPKSAKADESLVEKRVARLKRQALQAEERRVLEALREAKRAKDTAKELDLAQRAIGIRKELERVGAA